MKNLQYYYHCESNVLCWMWKSVEVERSFTKDCCVEKKTPRNSNHIQFPKTNSYLLYIFSFFIFTTSTFAQLSNISIGGGIGLGSISGNLPSQTSFGAEVFLEAKPFIKPFNSLKINFIFAQKLEKILPENRVNRYYPFITSFSLTANGKQYLNKKIFVGEGFGFLILNDRTYNDVNSWNYGLAIDFFIGIKILPKVELIFKLNNGLTLNNTNAGFTLFLFQGKYHLADI